jgi:hypothetical protein
MFCKKKIPHDLREENRQLKITVQVLLLKMTDKSALGEHSNSRVKCYNTECGILFRFGIGDQANVWL